MALEVAETGGIIGETAKRRDNAGALVHIFHNLRSFLKAKL